MRIPRSLWAWGLLIGSLYIVSNAGAQNGDSVAAHDVWKALQTVNRVIPDSGDHPGNVFLAGEDVIVQASPSIPMEAATWRILDDHGNTVVREALNSVQRSTSQIKTGALGVGWYRIEFLNAQDQCLAWTTAAVLKKLLAPVPQDSPICVDGANSWFARENPSKQEKLSRLAALAGVNWIRDRLRWGEIEPEENHFAEKTTYDVSAMIESQFGLKILQVFHDTPFWAWESPVDRGHFPTDLRVLYNFCQAMSARFKDRVQAWEPWNEANAPDFGGQTVDEICALQKAAFLGFKAGNPAVTVCMNAYAGVPTPLHTQGVLENETWPYFDTYNIHTYDWPHSYETLRMPVYEAASGRPIWVTESDRGTQYVTGEPWCDLSPESEHLKAEFIAQSYASSLFAGCTRHFHFILGHYFEGRGGIQFGLLRLDLTPRPAYSALAAVGRILAGARCTGRLKIENQPNQHIYVFRAWPDGLERDVLVAWAEGETDWPKRGKIVEPLNLPEKMTVLEVDDYLGRALDSDMPEVIKSEPVFILLPPGETDSLPLEKPPVRPFREGTPSPVVLQLVMSATSTVRVTECPWSVEQEHQVEANKELGITLAAYNFGDQPVNGHVKVEHLPDGWRLEPSEWEVSLEPMDCQKLQAAFVRPAPVEEQAADCWIKLRGDFGEAGKPVLAFRLIARPGEGYPK